MGNPLTSWITTAALAACAAAPRASLADDPQCFGAVGPDLIVGNIPNATNYSNVGSVEAFSFGADICNLGTVDAAFQTNTTRHPILSQGLFRLKDGRFEQIGQSWVMHTFVALAQNQCGCGCNGHGASVLGSGCSDPESSSITGSQFVLGPKSEVNAAIGTFVMPFGQGDQGSSGNPIYKRLQAHVSDLDPSQNGGGQYIVELRVIAADDAAAGNSANNSSYREVQFSGAGETWNVSITPQSQTLRGQSAIRAWRASDPMVSETEVLVPGDGLLILAAKATDLGAGWWHYEYALQNIDGDRAAGSLMIPLPSGVSVDSIGFHDVDYHSGEPFDGTDWTGAAGSQEVAWATDDFAVNPNANALRWGTLYNFRFDADREPGTISAEIGLFKPGTPAALSVHTIGPATCSDNNTCTDDSFDGALGCQYAPRLGPCDDGDPCTRNDTCDDAATCLGSPVVFGDVFPIGIGDGIVELGDILCLVAGYDVLADCPDGDIIPCGGGDGLIELSDLMAGLDGYSGIDTCLTPCPP